MTSEEQPPAKNDDNPPASKEDYLEQLIEEDQWSMGEGARREMLD